MKIRFQWLLLLITTIFLLIWIIDVATPTFKPNYTPFLEFLKITQGFLGFFE